jgi:predicted amidohydrolase YtcJ
MTDVTLIEVGSPEFTGVLTGTEKALITDMANAAGKLANTRKKLAETMASNGWTGWIFKKDYIATCHKAEALRLNEAATFIKGSIAKGLLNKDQLKLWLMDSKEANKAGLQNERNKLTSDVNAYFSSFRTMLDNAYFALHPEVMEKLKADSEKAKAEAGDSLEDEKSGLESAPEKMELNAENLLKHINELTLMISASKDASIVAVRAKLIPAMNAIQSTLM